MADLPSDQKPESGGTQHAKNDANSKKIQAEKEKIKSPKERPMRIRGILYEIFFWIFTAIAGFICAFTHTLAIVSIPLFWVGLIFAGLWLRRSLLNNGSIKRSANGWCVGIWIPSTIISMYVFCVVYAPEPPIPPPPPKPHFHVALLTTDSSGEKPILLHLTNDLMRMTKGVFPFVTGRAGFVNIPIKLGNSNAVLQFLVVNDSATDATYDDFSWRWNSKMKIPVTEGWRALLPTDGFSDAVSYFPGQFTKSGDGHSVPQLTILGVFESSFGSAEASIRGSNFDDYYGFGIRFVVDSNMSAYESETTLRVVGSNWVFDPFPPRKSN